MSLTVLTWNLMHPDYALKDRFPNTPPAYLAWSYRKEKIESLIKQLKPDLVCAQEVQWDDHPELPEYEWVIGLNKKRQKEIDKGKRPLLCAVAYLKERFQGVQQVITGSRSVTVTLLTELGPPVTVTSLHLPTSSTQERLQHLRKVKCDIVAGDFNDFPGTEPVQYLCREEKANATQKATASSAGQYLNVYDELRAPLSTYYLDDVVDYIFCRAPWRPKRISWSSNQSLPSASIPSDHHWVMLELVK